jgi:hypothetical protein
MFRALSAMNTGESEEGFQPSSYSDYVVSQTKLFNTQLPNAYPLLTQSGAGTKANDLLKQSKFSLAAWDPNTRQTSLRDIDLAGYATDLNESKMLLEMQKKCKASSIDDLINTEDPAARIRCGWIYEKGDPGHTPKLSVGNVGTRNGPYPLENTPSGPWFWNLEEAKKQILTDRCNSLKSCKDVGQQNYANCAYSVPRGIGVPVDQRGKLLYPRDPKLTAPTNSLVTNPNNCPPPPPPNSAQAQNEKEKDECTPLDNGSLSRDCILKQITQAGCKEDGALYTALQTRATPANYAAGLMNNVAFQKYQQLARPALRDEVIRNGKASKEDALTNFKQLAANTEGPYSALRFSARDLCTKVGIYDTYDFCNELSDTNVGPYPMDCLQRAFRQAGGQPAGSEYPSDKTMNKWNSLPTWKDVRTRIDDLKALTFNTNTEIQAKALKDFLGIIPDPLSGNQITRIPGIEIFYFDRWGSGAFIGRRVRLEGRFPSGFSTRSTVEVVDNTGPDHYMMIEYFAMANLRPPTDQKVRLRLTTDDGMIAALNTNNIRWQSRGRYASTENELSVNWDQAPTEHTARTCWSLRKNGPNYVNLWWQESFGITVSEVFYQDCESPKAWERFPPSWFTLTQEPDAPLISFQITAGNFVERRMPTFLAMRTGRTTVDAETKEIVFSSNDSFFSIERNIRINAFRTWTCSFRTTSTTKGRLFDLGGTMRIFIDGANVRFTWSGRTLTVDHSFSNVLNTTGEYNYIYFNMRSDYQRKYPNRITIAAGTHSDFVTGNVNVQLVGNNVATFTSRNDDPLYDPDRDNSTISSGGIGIGPKDVRIKNVRFFDYELLNDQIVRDIQDKWEMKFPIS